MILTTGASKRKWFITPIVLPLPSIIQQSLTLFRYHKHSSILTPDWSIMIDTTRLLSILLWLLMNFMIQPTIWKWYLNKVNNPNLFPSTWWFTLSQFRMVLVSLFSDMTSTNILWYILLIPFWSKPSIGKSDLTMLSCSGVPWPLLWSSRWPPQTTLQDNMVRSCFRDPRLSTSWNKFQLSFPSIASRV